MRNGSRGHGRARWLILTLLLLTLLIGGGFAARNILRPDNSIDPTRLARVERGDIARSVVATGKIEPRAKVEVKSKASGIVQSILVDYGQYVKTGQVLIELDKEELRARVREARAALLAAQAAEESAIAAYERNKAEAQGPDLPFLKANMERARQLNAEGLISRSAMEEAERQYELAFNKQLVAQRNVAVTKAEIGRARAQVAQAQANLDRAEEDLRNSTIVSPMDGLVLARNVEVGDAVSSILVLGSQATLLFTLGDVSDVYVLGKVDQADIGRVRLGLPARITVESFKDRNYEGAVTKISPWGEEKDNVTTFEVRVSIKHPGPELKANMSANAEIVLEEKHGVLLAPESAVLYDRDRNATVEVPDPSHAKGRRAVAIKTGISNGVRVEVLEGLKEGDPVILQ
jgi:HlyD family secretion protein